MINKDLGIATAYAYAVSQGYTGTEEDFAELMASYASVAQEAGAARDAAVSAKDTAVLAKDTAVNAVDGFEDTVEAETTTAVQAVQGAGSAQIAAVQAEGTSQVTAVQNKGTEVIGSIPADYTQLNQDVTDLKSDLKFQANGLLVLNSSYFESGTYNSSFEPIANTARIRSKKIPVHKGDTITMKSGAVCDYIAYGTFNSVGVWSDVTSWSNETRKIVITDQTYIAFICKSGSAGTATISPSDFDALIEFETATNQSLKDLESDLAQTNKNIALGYIQITSDDFEQGGYTNQGQKAPSDYAIRPKNSFSIKAGDKLVTEANRLYMGWYLIKDGAVVESGFDSNGYRIKLTDKTYIFSHDGELYILIATAWNYANSSLIVPSDMDATIKIINSYATTAIDEISSRVDSLEMSESYIYNEQVSVAPSVSASSDTQWLFFPCKFVPNHNYVVKIRFSAFVSSWSRKYSLRTTVGESSSADSTVQMIKVVDGTNPTIAEEYEFNFKAIKKSNGNTANYICLELGVTGNTACTLEVFSVKAEDIVGESTSTDIVSLNQNVPNYIRQGRKPFNRATTTSLALLHFSDIHGDETNLQRMVDMKNELGTMIDDTICTGDMVYNNYSATCMDFWDNVDGAESIMMCIGNHDVADGQHGYSSDQIGQTVAYQKYFAPYISNWNVNMAGTNLTYWYKDYASRKVRVIALNYLLTGSEQTAQDTWLASRLAEAKANAYAVVILEHTPLNSFANIDCNFSIIGLPWSYNEFPTIYQDTVQAFIDDGGEFVCYLAGHSHCDYVGYNSNYPNQLCVAVTTALTTDADNDQRRAIGEKSQDAGNIVLVDTVTKTVKLVRVGADMDCYLRGRNLFSINYSTKEVIANS